MTLMEALVVTAVTVLVGGIMFPSLQRSTERLAEAQARTAMTADLRRSRADAVRSARPVTLTVADDGRSYRVGGVRRELTAGVTLAPAGAALTFHADGSIRGAPLALKTPARGARGPASSLRSRAS